jgi:exonuclease III
VKLSSWNVNGLRAVLAKDFRACLAKAFIRDKVPGSDHCPIGIELDLG